MKNYLISTLLLFSATFGYSTPKQQNKNSDTRTEIETYISNVKKFCFTNTDSATYYYNLAYNKSVELKANDLIGRTIAARGIIKLATGNLNEALVFMKKGLSFLQHDSLLKHKANIYNNIGLVYQNMYLIDSSLYYFKLCEKLYAALNDSLYVADTWNNIATLFHYNNLYDSAMAYYKKCINYYTLHKEHKEYEADAILNMGNLYFSLFDYATALKNFQYAAEVYQSIQHNYKLQMAFMAIQSVFYKQKKYIKSLEYLNKAISIINTGKNNLQLANLFQSKANIYDELNQTDSALYYYNTALNYFIQLQEKRNIAMVYHNMALTYLHRNEMEKSEEHFLKSYKLKKQLGDNNLILSTASGLAGAYITMGKYDKALPLLVEGYNLSVELNDNEQLADIAWKLSFVYAQKKNYDKAYAYLLQAYDLKDTLYNEHQQQILQEIETKYEVEKKEIENQKLQENVAKGKIEIELRNAQIEKQKSQSLLLYLILFFAGIIIFCSFFVIRKFKKNNEIIKSQKNEVENQKIKVEIKQKEILDSIHYAQRIQQSIQPKKEKLAELFPESFIFFQPKDIVSGDFFWFTQANHFIYVVAADCTGHGVPGSLMSMIGMNSLHQIIVENHITETHQILNTLHIKIKTAMNADASAARPSNDGMDLALIRFDVRNKSIQFSGAARPLFYFKNKELFQWKGDRYSIGGIKNEETSYQLFELPAEEFDTVYLFSDGYADQMGGGKQGGKKLKISGLKQILENIQNKTMKEQEIAISTEYNQWKGELEQIDDVCVIGIRV